MCACVHVCGEISGREEREHTSIVDNERKRSVCVCLNDREREKEMDAFRKENPNV